MLSLDQTEFAQIEGKVKDLLSTKLKSPKLESMSVVDGKVNLQYQYRKESSFDWTAFTTELSAAAAPSRLEIFVGCSTTIAERPAGRLTVGASRRPYARALMLPSVIWETE